MNTNSWTINNKIPFKKKKSVSILFIKLFSNLLTNDLQITVKLYSLADFGLKLISTEIVSFGNKVPKPSFGCTSAYFQL